MRTQPRPVCSVHPDRDATDVIYSIGVKHGPRWYVGLCHECERPIQAVMDAERAASLIGGKILTAPTTMEEIARAKRAAGIQSRKGRP